MNLTLSLDRNTQQYFDDHLPEYRVSRYARIRDFVKQVANDGDKLIDIGCGCGNVIKYFREAVGKIVYSGMDISPSLLEKAQADLDCELVLGSVLDDNVIDSYSDHFEFVLLGGILHHLVGKSRPQSRKLSEIAIRNALRMTKPHGYLIILEPVYRPKVVVDIVFHVKRYVSRFSSRRVEIFSANLNIGPPIVSYLDIDDLKAMTQQQDATIVELHADSESRLLFGLVSFWLYTIIARKPGPLATQSREDVVFGPT